MHRKIVVGVDGSQPSMCALRWAAEEARRVDGTVLRLVMASEPHYPVHLLDPAMPAASPITDLELEAELRQADRVDAMAQTEAEATMHKMIAEVGLNASTVILETRAARGHPAKALVDAADDADLLVVGSRGHGGFTGLLLGSVSAGVAHHAPCPVVIVPKCYQD